MPEELLSSVIDVVVVGAVWAAARFAAEGDPAPRCERVHPPLLPARRCVPFAR